MLRYTLLTDGSSDKALMGIIKWLLDDLFPQLPNKGEFADFRGLPSPPNPGDVACRIVKALELYPCDILFYHRDAEKREKDIVNQRKEVLPKTPNTIKHVVCVVPVAMMETWLLIDETAIKKAAGNRNYKGEIKLPSPNSLEAERDPKSLLHKLLKEASGLKGRNLERFNVRQAVHWVVENIRDFSVLRGLEAFQVFEDDLKKAVNEYLMEL